MVENNLYGEYTPLRETTPLDDLARPCDVAYAMPGEIVDGQDVAAVHDAVIDGHRRAREPATDRR